MGLKRLLRRLDPLAESRLFWFTIGYFLGYGLFELGRRFSW